MNTNETTSWEILTKLPIDDPNSALKFSGRLARENNWNKNYALKLVDEYKKFVFLAKHAGHPVTPSVEVDEVWHLHMIYTQSYWVDMCKTLDFQLHHGPTKGGKAENDKYTNWYEKTLESYRKYFGEPPADCWPESKIRFAPTNTIKIDKSKFFLIKKPNFSFKKNKVLACSTLPLIILSFFSENWLWLLIGGIILWIIIALIVRSIKNNDRNNNNGGSSCGSSDSGMAWLIFACGSSCGSSSSHSDGGGHGCSSGDGGSSGCGSSCSSSCGSGCGGGCGS